MITRAQILRMQVNSIDDKAKGGLKKTRARYRT